MKPRTVAARTDAFATRLGVDDAHRCQMEVRDAVSFTLSHRCPQRAVAAVTMTCAHRHVDVDKLCAEHAHIAGAGSCCTECATSTEPHACPVIVEHRRPLR